MASSGNFAMSSSTHPRQQHGGEGTAALTLKADQLQHTTNVRYPNLFASICKYFISPIGKELFNLIQLVNDWIQVYRGRFYY